MTKRTNCIIPLWLLTDCSEGIITQDINADIPVVEAYLEEGMNTLSTKLYNMEVHPGEDLASSKPLTGMSLRVNGKEMTEYPAGTYSLALGDAAIRCRQEFKLAFDYQGKTIKAATIVPRPVTNLKIEPEFIVRTLSSSLHNWDNMTKLLLSWDDPEHSYYQVYIEPVALTAETSCGPGFGRRMMKPFQGNCYVICSMKFPAIGDYNIYLYRVNKDYVELYERINSSDDLPAPSGFIDNALGIFTSVSFARVRVTVLQCSE